jgi:hypothetical protein
MYPSSNPYLSLPSMYPSSNPYLSLPSMYPSSNPYLSLLSPSDSTFITSLHNSSSPSTPCPSPKCFPAAAL